ncbi:hypothetical protein F8M41_002402 [Gigaspora margarita]|uniref:Uncharacterized protein n=1 Tax=Gigaspora margarita TaxID=4874 RepID=A0A8H3XCX3_GIGMA|nr:hypothetical protein F8M41_002402 [Gigaspora margarita]
MPSYMFNDSIKSEEEFDTDYVSDTENLDDLLQFSDETLDIEKMLDFNPFLNEKTNKETNEETKNYPEPEDDNSNYNIEDVINASIANKDGNVDVIYNQEMSNASETINIRYYYNEEIRVEKMNKGIHLFSKVCSDRNANRAYNLEFEAIENDDEMHNLDKKFKAFDEDIETEKDEQKAFNEGIGIGKDGQNRVNTWIWI